MYFSEQDSDSEVTEEVLERIRMTERDIDDTFDVETQEISSGRKIIILYN